MGIAIFEAVVFGLAVLSVWVARVAVKHESADSGALSDKPNLMG